MNVSVRIFLLVLVIALLLTPLILFTDTWLLNPFEAEVPLNFAVNGIEDGDGNIYIVDTALRRIKSYDADGILRYEVYGGRRDRDGFFYADDIIPDEAGGLYIINQLRDTQGFYLLNEQILHIDDQGAVSDTLYEQVYTETEWKPTLVQRGEMTSLQYESGQLHWLQLKEDEVIAWSLDLSQDEAQPKRNFFMDLVDARLVVADIQRVGNDLYYSTKDGFIYRWSRGGRELIYDATFAAEEVVPWEIAVLNSSEVYIVDLEHRSIRQIINSNSSFDVINRDLLANATANQDLYDYDIYRLNGYGNTLYTVNDEGLVSLDRSGNLHFFNGGKRSTSQILAIVGLWISFAALIAFIIILLVTVHRDVFNGKLPKVLTRSLSIVLLIMIVAGIAAAIIITDFSERYQGVVLDKIKQMLQVMPKVVNGDLFLEMDDLSEFGSDNYYEIRETFLDGFNESRDEWNKGYYFALYRVIDERLYGFMYMNGFIGTRYPFDWLGGADDPGVYDLAQLGQIETELITDISGDWIYGVSPILDSNGNVVAIFETGTDLYTLRVANEALVRDLILQLITVLIVIILFMIEITIVSEMKNKRQELIIKPDLTKENFSDTVFARPLIFFYFIAVSMSVAFIPLLAKELFEPIPGFADELVLALPLSVEMLAFGIATTITGFLTRKLGWRAVFYFALGLTIGGLIYSALAPSLYHLMVARAVSGFGSGMSYLAVRTLINNEKRTALRNASFSHFYAGMVAGVNVGLVAGASLADIVGFQNVFWVASAIAFISGFIPFIYLRRIEFIERGKTVVEKMASFSVFLKSPRLWVFMLFVVFPTYLASSFIGFHFPLFAESQGLSTGDIGRYLIMNGLFIIYLGPSLSRFIEKNLGHYWGTILTSVMWGGFLIFAAVTNSILGAVLALAFMGITEGIGVSAQNSFYLDMKEVQSVGEDHAVGFFEFFGKIGETVGPMIFALALTLGQVLGISVLGAVVVGLIPLFMLVVRNRKEA